jgi:DNA-binding XRE family transcriptional regulator
MSGVSEHTILAQELERSSNPTQTTANALAQAIGVPVHALFFGDVTDIPVIQSTPLEAQPRRNA